MDHRIQYRLERAGQASSRKSFYRLSQEPLILSHWDRIANLDFTLDAAANFASLLCAERIGLRQGPMWATGPAGHIVVFEEAAASRRWLDDLLKLRQLGLSPLTEAIVTYARIIVAHPVENGNGRLARAMFYGPLARAGVLSAPCLALGSVLEAKRESVAYATIALAQSGDWPTYIDEIIKCIDTATSLVEVDFTTS